MSLPVIVLGAGGHAKVLIDALLKQSIQLLGITDPDPALTNATILGIPLLGDDDAVLLPPISSNLVSIVSAQYLVLIIVVVDTEDGSAWHAEDRKFKDDLWGHTVCLNMIVYLVPICRVIEK